MLCWTNPRRGPTRRKIELAELIRKVNTELGVTVLLIEHDMKLVMSVAQRIVVLNFGGDRRRLGGRDPTGPGRNKCYLGSAETDDPVDDGGAAMARRQWPGRGDEQ